MMWIIFFWTVFIVGGFLVVYFRRHIRWTYESILLWLAIRRAQKELKKIGKGNIADAIRWDEKWYGRKDN